MRFRTQLHREKESEARDAPSEAREKESLGRLLNATSEHHRNQQYSYVASLHS